MKKSSDIKKQTLIYSVTSTMIIGLILHIFAYTNLLLGHDSGFIVNISPEIINGRFAKAFFYKLFLNGLQMPAAIGFLTLLSLSLTCYLICISLNINSKVGIITTAIVLVSSPALISMNCYANDVFSYVFGMMLACVGAYICRKYKLGFAFAIIIISIAISCYQSNYGIVLGMFALYIISDILDTNTSISKVFLNILKYTIVSLLAMTLYYVEWEFLLRLNNLQRTSYLGMSSLGISSIYSMVYSIIPSLKTVIKYFFVLNSHSYYPAWLMLISMLSFIIASISMVKTILKSNRSITRFILLAISVIILIISINIGQIISFNQSQSALIKYPFVLIYILAIMVVISNENNSSLKYNKFAVYLLSVCIFINSFYGANLCYTKLKSEYDSSISLTTQIMCKVQNMPGYTSDKQVLFVGVPKYPNYDKQFSWCDDITGANYNTRLTYYLPIIAYAKQLNPMMNISHYSVSNYLNDERYLKLDCFPSENCTTIIDDKYIIKLDNW